MVFVLVQNESLDKFYEIYVKNMRNSYENLLTTINDFNEFAIGKKVYKLKDEFQTFLNKDSKKLPPPFFLPKKDLYQDLPIVAPVFFQSPRNLLNSIIYIR